MAAPDTLEAMLEFARTQFDIVAPAGDLIYTNAYDILMDGVTDGFVVGKAVIEGVRCDHLAFRAAHVDLQIWVQEGKQPLPRKLVITTRDLVNAPQFAVTVTQVESEADIRRADLRLHAAGRCEDRLPAALRTGSRHDIKQDPEGAGACRGDAAAVPGGR
jgi:hypothetical protein